MKRILAVDDDQFILESLYHVLRAEGYEAIMASDGTTVEQVVKRFKPDLILLDIRLSGCSGVDVARSMKQNNKTKNIPIILISANYHAKETVPYSTADDFIEKPFDVGTLTQTIRKYVH